MLGKIIKLKDFIIHTNLKDNNHVMLKKNFPIFKRKEIAIVIEVDNVGRDQIKILTSGGNTGWIYVKDVDMV